MYLVVFYENGHNMDLKILLVLMNTIRMRISIISYFSVLIFR